MNYKFWSTYKGKHFKTLNSFSKQICLGRHSITLNTCPGADSGLKSQLISGEYMPSYATWLELGAKNVSILLKRQPVLSFLFMWRQVRYCDCLPCYLFSTCLLINEAYCMIIFKWLLKNILHHWNAIKDETIILWVYLATLSNPATYPHR